MSLADELRSLGHKAGELGEPNVAIVLITLAGLLLEGYEASPYVRLLSALSAEMAQQRRVAMSARRS